MKGRKRKNGPRTPSGQLSRAGQDHQPRETARHQPHRNGALSEWRGSAVGRFLEDDRHLTRGCDRSVLYDAANRFATAYAEWQIAVASRRPVASTWGSARGEEDTERTLRIIARYEAARKALQHQGQAVRQATHAVLCDPRPEDYVMPHHVQWHLTQGLKALAEHYGLAWEIEEISRTQRKTLASNLMV